MRLNPGDLVGGKYRIARLIGDGGMGAVYEARHEVLGSLVALKFLHPELTNRPGLASRFLQEARVSASIQSPHVTRVTDVDTLSDGSPYLVMELLIGESLQQLLDRRSKLPKDQALDFALQILSGLEAAHARGVVHRDLKPDNVYVTPSSGGPLIKLLDFGIAKLKESNEYQKGLTRPGALMGTPEYMAPEQLYAAERVDHRADLYSVGAILYEMLTGARPAYGDDASQIIAQVVTGKVRRVEELDPSLPRALGDVLHRALAAEKDQRFPGALEMRLALAPFAGRLSHAGRLAATPAPPDTDAHPPPTLDGPALAPSYVPATGTWASGNPAMQAMQKGATQEAPKDLMRQLSSAHAAHSAVNYTPSPAPYAAAPAPYQQAPGVPGAYFPESAGPLAYGSLPGTAGGYAANAKRGSNRVLGAVLALTLGVLVAGAVVFAFAMIRRSSEQARTNQLPGAPSPTSGAAPVTTISAQPTAVQSPATQTKAAPAAPRPPAQKAPRRPRAPEPSPQAPIADAAPTLPFPPITLPEGFPPLPSNLPPLPSGFPQIPGLPFPTEQPAPAPNE